jgi:hypothetical protein
MQVVAEGVESEAQARLLAGLGCAAAQGFLFGRPMGLVELYRWLEDRVPTPPSGSGSTGHPLGRPEHALDPDDPTEPLGEVGGFGRAHAGELEIDHELVAGQALAMAALGYVTHRREHLEHARQRRGFGPGLNGKAEGDGHGRTSTETVEGRAERPGLSARPGL